MLESFSLALFLISFASTILAFRYSRLEFFMFAILFWLLSAAGTVSVEIPYTVAIGENVVSGTHAVYSQAPLAVVCIGIGIVLLLYVIAEVMRQ